MQRSSICGATAIIFTEIPKWNIKCSEWHFLPFPVSSFLRFKRTHRFTFFERLTHCYSHKDYNFRTFSVEPIGNVKVEFIDMHDHSWAFSIVAYELIQLFIFEELKAEKSWVKNSKYHVSSLNRYNQTKKLHKKIYPVTTSMNFWTRYLMLYRMSKSKRILYINKSNDPAPSCTNEGMVVSCHWMKIDPCTMLCIAHLLSRIGGAFCTQPYTAM